MDSEIGDQQRAALGSPARRQLQVGALGCGVCLRVALERQVVHDRQRLARPCKRDDVGGHEKQVGMLTRQGERKAHLRPQSRERRDRHVDAETGARPRCEEAPVQVGRRRLQARADLASVYLGARNHLAGRGVQVYGNRLGQQPANDNHANEPGPCPGSSGRLPRHGRCADPHRAARGRWRPPPRRDRQPRVRHAGEGGPGLRARARVRRSMPGRRQRSRVGGAPAGLRHARACDGRRHHSAAGGAVRAATPPPLSAWRGPWRGGRPRRAAAG